MTVFDSATLEHPATSELQALFNGGLERSRREEIEAHLLECESCCSRLDQLDKAEDGADEHDPLVRRIREIDSATDPWCDTSHDAISHDLNDADDEQWRRSIQFVLRDHPRYEIQDEIGSGGMGIVFRARHRMMRRNVVLKVINRRVMLHKTATARFRRETRAAARLSHPAIVAAYDSEEYRGLHFLAMEHVEGTNLAALVEQQGPLDPVQASDYIRQAAEGLQHAFERRMVHRDIKPQNLMLTPNGTIKILDFGLAKFVRDELVGSAAESDEDEGLSAEQLSSEGLSGELTRVDSVLGTLGYAAPEQILDPTSADIRSDIYGLGAVLHFLLTGQPPDVIAGPVWSVPPESTQQGLSSHDQDGAASPGSSDGDQLTTETADLTGISQGEFPPGVYPVLSRMLARDPDERYQTPADVVSALSALIRPETPLEKQRTPGLGAVAVTIAALACLAFGLDWFARGRVDMPAAQDRAQTVPVSPNRTESEPQIPPTISQVTSATVPGDDELTVAFWNVEKLYDTVIDSEDAVQSPFGMTGNGWTDRQLKARLKNLARVISDMAGGRGPDVLGLSEVENANVLSLLIEHLQPLKRDYIIVHNKSSDSMGLNCSLIYDREHFELIDQKFHFVQNANSRDIVEARLSHHGDPLTVFVADWTAQQNNARATGSAASLVRQRIDEILLVEPAADIMLIGNIHWSANADVSDSTLRASTSAEGLGDDELFNSSWDQHSAGSGTFVNEGEWELRDHIVLSSGLLNPHGFEWVPGSTEIIQREYQMVAPTDSGVIPVPASSFDGNEFDPRGFSDHLPVACRIKLVRPAGPESVKAGLVAWWPLDETEGDVAHDASGNGHDGLLSASPHAPTRAAGRIGGGLDFRNAGEAVVIDPPVKLNGDWTISLWIRQSTYSNRGIILGTRRQTALKTDGARISFRHKPRGRGHAFVSEAPPDKWVPIVLVCADEKLRYYADGHFGDSFDLEPIPLVIRQMGSTNGDDTLGATLDDIRVYNRALTRDEIARLARVNPPPETSPDRAETTIGQSIDIDVLANDSDPQGDEPRVVSIGPLLTSYRTAVRGDSLGEGWTFLANVSADGDLNQAPIGSSTSYQPLEFQNTSDPAWRPVLHQDLLQGLHLNHTGGRAGPGRNDLPDVENLERFAIAAFKVSRTGDYCISNSFIKPADDSPNERGGGDIFEVRVYANDRLMQISSNITGSKGHRGTFDTTLGTLNEGSTIYVAVGPRGVGDRDFEWDFHINGPFSESSIETALGAKVSITSDGTLRYEAPRTMNHAADGVERSFVDRFVYSAAGVSGEQRSEQVEVTLRRRE